MATVFIVNKSSHDCSAAKRFGNIRYLSEGRMNRYATTNIFRQCQSVLQHSRREDYILITSLNSINVIACCIFVLQHKCLNLLLHSPKDNNYVERNLDFSGIKEVS